LALHECDLLRVGIDQGGVRTPQRGNLGCGEAHDAGSEMQDFLPWSDREGIHAAVPDCDQDGEDDLLGQGGGHLAVAQDGIILGCRDRMGDVSAEHIHYRRQDLVAGAVDDVAHFVGGDLGTRGLDNADAVISWYTGEAGADVLSTQSPAFSAG